MKKVPREIVQKSIRSTSVSNDIVKEMEKSLANCSASHGSHRSHSSG